MPIQARPCPGVVPSATYLARLAPLAWATAALSVSSAVLRPVPAWNQNETGSGPGTPGGGCLGVVRRAARWRWCRHTAQNTEPTAY